MRISTSLRWLVVALSAAMLLAVAAACSSETIEVPGETVVVEKEVIKTVEVPGETVTVEVIKEVMVPGETVVVEKVVTETVEVPGETVVVEKEVVKTVEVPGQTVVVEKVVVQEVPAGYVTDPTTGKAVTAPAYGGTFTGPLRMAHDTMNLDPYWPGGGHFTILEKLGTPNWGLHRDELPSGFYVPLSALTEALAESWSQPDPLTYVLKIRQGVKWHNKAPMNGRELDANDIEYNFQRYSGLGKFSNFEPSPVGGWSNQPIESITATDKWTVVVKLKEPLLDMQRFLLDGQTAWIQSPELIEESKTTENPQGKVTDWRKMGGTGPYELTDYVVGGSRTYTKNPDYWDFDEKYPEYRLPYIDEMKFLVMPEEATIMAALRTAKIDYRGNPSGGSAMRKLDDVFSLQKTTPEIELWAFSARSPTNYSTNVNYPPFDDIRVRHALQMALDLETINATFLRGLGITTPKGMQGTEGYYVPFEEWPEEVKSTYRYDAAAAEALLDEAGYPRGADDIRFKTTYTHYAPFDMAYAEISIEYWRAIGIEIEIVSLEPAEFNPLRNQSLYKGIIKAFGGAKFDPVMMIGWGRSDSNLNYPAWNEPALDARVDAALAATTHEEQRRLARELDMYQIENRWMIWGPEIPVYFANWPWLKGYNGEPWDLMWARIWIDPELKAAMGY